MCIINLINSKVIQDAVNKADLPKLPSGIFAAFVPTKSIQHIINIKPRYSLIMIAPKNQTIDIQLVHATNRITSENVSSSLDQLRELLVNKSPI